MDWLIDIFYYEGDLLKSFIAIFAFMILLVVLLEGFYVIRSAAVSVK